MNISQDYVEVVVALKMMRDSPGWKFFCAEFDERFNSLTDTILDGTTDAVTAERLRQARCRIVQEFTPAQIMDQLLTKTGARADAQLRANGVRADNQT